MGLKEEKELNLITRIEIERTIPDTRSKKLKSYLNYLKFPVEDVKWLDVYTINNLLSTKEAENIAQNLAIACNNKKGIKVHEAHINEATDINGYDWAIETGFRPGVTDNIGKTAKSVVEDTLDKKISDVQGVYNSRLLLLKGQLSIQDLNQIQSLLINPLIQRGKIKNSKEYSEQEGMDVVVPKVKLERELGVLNIDLSKEDLKILGDKGVYDLVTKERRGPLALDIESLTAIKNYYEKIKRNPTDIELESIAQTWSEHCKHRIFSGAVDDNKEGIFKKYIRGATELIRKQLGERDFCTSVFSDNSGAIKFDEDFSVCFKSETHNSPSALDPFGGSITGIVGVNRDTLGFGLGALPVCNSYYFVFGELSHNRKYFKDKALKNPTLSAEAIMRGVISGVNAGGNQSGIPTNLGGMYMFSSLREVDIKSENYTKLYHGFDGKPLVFVGTSGIIPTNKIEKKANSGDLIVIIGGRTGADGIHGATFSSVEFSEDSPATAVQIGDPITQKKLTDALIKDARDLSLYTSITDNGAGGLSCSVAEMAQESGGFHVNLNNVLLKYEGLQPWEIWVSESQERMTLSVPKDKINQFKEIMKKHDVEMCVIGEFNESGKAEVEYNGKTIMNIDMEFLHKGDPKKIMSTKKFHEVFTEPDFEEGNLTNSLEKILSRFNMCSTEFISTQYDHEVQGGSVIKPLMGKGRLQSKAGVYRPKLDTYKGVVESNSICPSYSDIDTYHMATCAIDTAVRNAISVGGKLSSMGLLDNFCWCSSEEPERLYQLKRAAEGCYDYATKLMTPFISGKDSMFNDFKGYDELGNKIKISVLPTLKIQACGVIEDTRKCVTHEAKFENDLVYVIGETLNELGGSEYFRMKGGFIGNNVPKVNFDKAIKNYHAVENAISKELLTSCNPVNQGGLAIALAEASLGGKLGINADINEIKNDMRPDYILFSESQSRFIVTVNPKLKDIFEKTMQGTYFKKIGLVKGDSLIINDKSKELINLSVNKELNAYKKTFANEMSVPGWNKDAYLQGDWL